MSAEPVTIGLISISDRASSGIYEDKGIPALTSWLNGALKNPLNIVSRVIPDEQRLIEATLTEFADTHQCALIFTTGGTGPAPRDVTPEATLAVATRVMDGFGERMRQISLHFVSTAILSRQVAVIRGQCLIVNLPGQPKAIQETLEGCKDSGGKPIEVGIFAAIPYCVDLIGGPYVETNDNVISAFRPTSARR